MALVSLGEIKSRLSITDTDDDAALQAARDAVSLMVEQHTGRDFDVATSATTRIFTAESVHRVEIDDAASVTTVEIDTTGDQSYNITLSSDDWQAYPINRTPKTHLIATYDTDYYFPTTRDGVRVTATWGYQAEVPAPVREVVILETVRLWQATRNPVGVIESQTTGSAVYVPALHPSSMAMLAPYRAFEVTA